MLHNCASEHDGGILAGPECRDEGHNVSGQTGRSGASRPRKLPAAKIRVVEMDCWRTPRSEGIIVVIDHAAGANRAPSRGADRWY